MHAKRRQSYAHLDGLERLKMDAWDVGKGRKARHDDKMLLASSGSQ
jgi:hypothetical protein